MIAIKEVINSSEWIIDELRFRNDNDIHITAHRQFYKMGEQNRVSKWVTTRYVREHLNTKWSNFTEKYQRY